MASNININKNSIASTIDGFIQDLEDYVLQSDEKVNDTPTSFVSLLTSTLAKIGAYSYYNNLMSKRECQPSTAILHKSLMRHLKSDQINEIYGNPSNFSIMIAYPEQDIINLAVADGDKYRLTLNKDTQFFIDSFPGFTLDYNVNIWVTKYKYRGEDKYSIYATYDVDDPEAGNVVSVNNPYVYSRNDIVQDDQKYFAMYLNVNQYVRETDLTEMNGESKNITVKYSDSLMGFVVLYRSQSSTEYTKVNCYLEGESFTDGVSYTLSDKAASKSITLKFSKLPGAFNPTNGVLKVVVYTTKGSEGNFKINNTVLTEEDVNNIQIKYAQDLSDVYQEAWITLIPTVSLPSGIAKGGKDALDIEGIRTLVVESQNGEVITPKTIKKEAKKKGFDAFKSQQDLVAYQYLLSTFLTVDSKTIPTRMIDGFFSFDQLEIDEHSNSRIIKPSDVFKYDENEVAYKLKKFNELEPYKEYFAEYKEDPTKQYCFPYFIKFPNGDDISLSIYDQSIDEVKDPNFIYIASKVLDLASVLSTRITRNPLSIKEVTDDYGNLSYEKDFYKVQFTVSVSDIVYASLKNLQEDEDPYVKFRIVLKDTTDTSKYARDIKLSDCEFIDEEKTIICNTYIKTTSSVLNSGKINTTAGSLKMLPYSNTQAQFQFVDGIVNLDIAVIFKETSETEARQVSIYDNYLTQNEIDSKYYIGVIYTVEKVELCKDISEYIDIVSDIKISQPEYEVAETDIPDTYTQVQYKMNNGEYVLQPTLVENMDGTKSEVLHPIVLHEVGAIKQNDPGRVGAFNTVSTDSWKWSSVASETGVYSAGECLEAEIYAIAQWKNKVIFAGQYGRICTYDITENRWYAYNDSTLISDPTIVKNDGQTFNPNGEENSIRGLKIVEYTATSSSGTTSEKAILFAYGDGGRVIGYDFEDGNWSSYGQIQGAIGNVNIYACEKYTIGNRDYLCFAGSDGRICSYCLQTNTQYNYAAKLKSSEKGIVISDGSERNYKAIYSISKYLTSSLYCAGSDGCVSVVNLTDGKSSLLDDGEIVDNKNIYTSCIYGNNYIIAGSKGVVASYDITRSSWLNSGNQGLTSDGVYQGNKDIFVSYVYGVNVIFAGEEGRISSYDVSSNTWNSYNSSSGLANDGSFIGGDIKAISYNNQEGDAVIYFGSAGGNIVYKYKKGDIIKDSNGKPIIKKDSQQIGWLKGIPAFARIYAVQSKFNDLEEAYENAINEISSLSSIFAGGCGLHLGVKTTSGRSSTYYFINPKTKVQTYLDSLTMNIHLGVKFESGITEENQSYLIDNIKTFIAKYISDKQNVQNSDTSVEINILRMLDECKEEVPNIEYFQYYSLNNYDSTICQTIYYERQSESENEFLSIQSTLDESESDLDTQEVVFIPNITIDVL